MINTAGHMLRRLIRPFGVDVVRYQDPTTITPAHADHTVAPGSGFESLRGAFPFAEPMANVRPLLLSDDGGGKEIVERLLRGDDVKVMLEIGSFFGASAIRWARLKPDLVVVCVDPWSDGWTASVAAQRGHAAFEQQLNQPDGLYQTFLKNAYDHRDQIIPVRGYCPAVLPRLLLLGLEPDLIYIDATKIIDDLIICHRLWPKAILTGDDWNWGPERRFPMQQAVKRFAAMHHMKIEQQLETWHLLP